MACPIWHVRNGKKQTKGDTYRLMEAAAKLGRWSGQLVVSSRCRARVGRRGQRSGDRRLVLLLGGNRGEENGD